jgi:hypothetical protein
MKGGRTMSEHKPEIGVSAEELIAWLKSEEGKAAMAEAVAEGERYMEQWREARNYDPDLLNLRMTI